MNMEFCCCPTPSNPFNNNQMPTMNLVNCAPQPNGSSPCPPMFYMMVPQNNNSPCCCQTSNVNGSSNINGNGQSYCCYNQQIAGYALMSSPTQNGTDGTDNFNGCNAMEALILNPIVNQCQTYSPCCCNSTKKNQKKNGKYKTKMEKTDPNSNLLFWRPEPGAEECLYDQPHKAHCFNTPPGVKHIHYTSFDNIK